MKNVVNISGYKFVPLRDLDALQNHLRVVCSNQSLKGTILLSEEGINCFVAGNRSGIDNFLTELRSIAAFSDFDGKESFSDYQPFSRMLVKIKKEIITFDMPEVQPAARTASKIPASELKTWLDEDRDFILLDTRNDYEIELGTFANATTVGIDNFREFPDAIKKLPEEYKSKPIVMFCTGGIRCEKAAPFMEDAGFDNVFQLDGGVLRYFEKCGGDHWDGECFVFDKRVALDPDLSETATTLCYVCQAVLSGEDQRQPTYKFGVSCTHCFTDKKEDSIRVVDLETRNANILAASTPLPGSIPYENFRPMTVSKEMDGLSLLDFLDALHTHIDRDGWIGHVEAGHILSWGKPVGLDRKVQHGQKYYHLLPDTTEPDVNPEIKVIYEDEDLVAIDKPAPLPMHPCGRFNKNSAQHILQEVYQPDRLRLVHRLDANTTGVVVYARTKALATALIEQFGQGRIEKTYLAGVYGKSEERQFESKKKIASRPGDKGIRFLDPDGQHAITCFQWLDDMPGGCSLLKAMPKTGRTNQIRLHLWDAGFPIVGDPTYLRDGQLGVNQTLGMNDTPMQLHALRIAFVHPLSKKEVAFEAEAPQWAKSESLLTL
jgi:RluA family pseudouridine synthase